MIEKLKTINPYEETEIDMGTNSVAGLVYENTPLIQKINELVDAVNELQKQYDSVCIWVGEQKLNYNPDTTKGLSTLVEESKPAENVQPDFITTSYMADGHIKEYYGQNGTRVQFNRPIPAGYTIIIKETKGE